MRQLYLGVCVPRMLYAADLFLSPPAVNRTLLARLDPKAHRTPAVIKKLRTIQRRAALAITGALRSTPTDVLDVYANLLPIEQLIDKVRASAALRIATRPATHPLHHAIRREAARLSYTHSSPLQDLVADFVLDPQNMERITAVRFPPLWSPTIQIQIPETKEDAIKADREDTSTYKVYTDGSGIDRRIGASAVLFKDGREIGALQLFLGDDDQHTVYEGEGIGGCLAMALLLKLDNLQGPVTIVVDNQAAVRAILARTPLPSHWIWDVWHGLAAALARRHPNAHVTVRWSPGHVGIIGNERADEEAKRAAQGRNSSPQQHIPHRIRGELPWGRSAVQQYLNSYRKTVIERQWRASPRYARTMQYDTKITAGSYITLADNLPRSLAVLLLQLRSGHVPLAKHLHRIQKADSPICPCCRQADESVVRRKICFP
ncbi:RNA-directed DNA polymerase from transposon X-element [Mycena sanguinolenta]|uniref:RNA-directed DNA polymerase from transposon X-element n=1 Tax=Mycena sanguinolenta TaxID=230812 RepID=A0A8H7D8R9_9AGAR|nr:RNA-directed DNA polymerase from transposon X-element [Mycena sanguinolenta]